MPEMLRERDADTATVQGWCVAKGQCLNCMDEQEVDLTVPVNRRDLINVIEAVTPKADVRLTASIGRNRPKADIND